MKKIIEDLWDYIADFEEGEVKNDSKNPIQANARCAARMEAYVRLFWSKLNLVP